MITQSQIELAHEKNVFVLYSDQTAQLCTLFMTFVVCLIFCTLGKFGRQSLMVSFSISQKIGFASSSKLTLLIFLKVAFDTLTFSMLGKMFSTEDILKYISCFCHKKRI